MEQKFRLHVIGLPIVPTNRLYSYNPFAQKCFLFCKMMKARGHYIIHYGIETSNPDCDENIAVVNWDTFLRDYWMNQPGKSNSDFNENLNTNTYNLFIQNTIKEIQNRLQPQDIILPFWGLYHEPICKYFYDKAFVVEPGIGYTGTFAPFRIYESYAMLTLDAKQNNKENNPSYYNVVIPPFFETTKQWNAAIEEDPYVLFVGRVGYAKGLNIAKEVCEKLNIHLKIAGPLSLNGLQLIENTDYLGPVSIEERDRLMSNAIAVMIPSTYLEPFGYVQVESLMCGTPIITTDWGSFPEVNKQGVTGYRCRTFDDFLNAVMDCYDNKICRSTCRIYAIRNYSFEVIAPQYEKYFRDLLQLSQKEGWYTIYPETEERMKKLKK